MIALLDEATPEVGGGICYVVATGVLLGDESMAKAALQAVPTADRRRPFHWHREGPRIRERMLAALHAIGVDGRAIVVPCGRSRQEAARAAALGEMVNDLADDGCDRLIIESRATRQDERDRRVILDALRRRRDSGALAYEWRTKSEPLLWIADTIGGAVGEHLLGVQTAWFDRIQLATGLELTYRQLPDQARKVRQPRLPS